MYVYVLIIIRIHVSICMVIYINIRNTDMRDTDMDMRNTDIYADTDIYLVGQNHIRGRVTKGGS
jgi:hypothetical protein